MHDGDKTRGRTGLWVRTGRVRTGRVWTGHHRAARQGVARRVVSRWLLVVALIQMLLLTVGCTSACPAVGWFDELKIEITGSSAGAVDRLEVCFAGSCYSGKAGGSTRSGTFGASDESGRFAESGGSVESGESGEPGRSGESGEPGEPGEPGDPGGFGGSAEPGESGSTLETVAVTKTGTGWTLTTPMQTPDTIQLRAFSVSGHLLAEYEVDLSWKRVGGSVRCGGPHDANTSISVGS